MTTAKKFVKKLSKVNYTCKNGEIIQTGCKVFGMPILKNGIPDGICSNCVDKENQLTCILQVAKMKKSVKVKTTRTIESDDYLEYLTMFENNEGKLAIITAAEAHNHSSAASAKIYSNLSCVFNAIKNPDAKNGIVHQSVRHFMHNGEVPKGDKATIKLVERCVKCYQAIPQCVKVE